jgi:hypothetical protein
LSDWSQIKIHDVRHALLAIYTTILSPDRKPSVRFQTVASRRKRDADPDRHPDCVASGYNSIWHGLRLVSAMRLEHELPHTVLCVRVPV